MNRPSVGYSFFLMMIAATSTPLRATDLPPLMKTMIADEYYMNRNCVSYLRGISPATSRTIMEDTKLFTQQDIIAYLSGGESLIGDLLDEKKIQLLPNSDRIKEARGRLKGKRKFETTFTGEGYSHEGAELAKKRLNNMMEGPSQTLDTKSQEKYIKYASCTATEVLNQVSPLADTYMAYEAYVMSHVESAKIGYFTVATGDNRIARKVGTGNPYAEPKVSPDSRFFIVDARFKNNDTESRLPFEGSLFISYNGKQYEFDSTEPIMLEGYNIWFRKVNPLITVKTKIVYRIPNEIEGEVFWRPGRNKEDTRLWVGYVKATK